MCSNLDHERLILWAKKPPEDDILRRPEVGLRVRRGPDWDWQDQELGGYSTWISGDQW